MIKQIVQWNDGLWRIRKLTILGWEYWEQPTDYWWFKYKKYATTFTSAAEAREAYKSSTVRWVWL